MGRTGITFQILAGLVNGRVVPLEKVQYLVDRFQRESVELHRNSEFLVPDEENNVTGGGVVFPIQKHSKVRTELAFASRARTSWKRNIVSHYPTPVRVSYVFPGNGMTLPSKTGSSVSPLPGLAFRSGRDTGGTRVRWGR